MTMLITRSQGAACRRAAERIDGAIPTETADSHYQPLEAIGWGRGGRDLFDWTDGEYDQSQVLMALLWCAEIAEEA